jgi:aminoglycoside phosphotransferase (APT) family kinase protein
VGVTPGATVERAEDRLREGLERFIARRSGAPAAVVGWVRLPGGTLRDAWGIDARIDAGPFAGPHRLVYLQDRGAGPLESRLRREDEFRVLSVMHAAGVRAPRPYWHVPRDDPEGLGSGLILEWVDGEAVGRRILEDPAFEAVRPRVLEQMGEELAKIHAVPCASVPGLPAPPEGKGAPEAGLDEVERTLREVEEPHPVLELALRWLRPRMPAPRRLVVSHGDYRLGNIVVHPSDGLRAVLDWELVHLADPGEDLAWVCIRFWQGVDQPGRPGLGPKQRFLDGYAKVAGWRLAPEMVVYWEVFANLRWAVITLRQARRHLTGRERSLELASIGRRCAEVEWELLRLIRAA